MRAWFAFALAFPLVACRYPNADLRFFPDGDADGFVEPIDCDDDDDDVNPGADESCNEIDDDCDATIDEDPIDPSTFWVDADDDGYGDDDLATVQGCAAPEGYAPVGGDCDDSDKDFHPTALDIADDDIDQDCNGHDTIACTVDADHDGFGTIALTTVFAADGSCDTAQGESGNHDDCLDDNASAHPGAQEVPGDGVDNDCAEGDADPCWADLDHDTYGDPAAPLIVPTCDADAQADNDDDCLPADPLSHPDGIEVPGDGIDQDCSGLDAPLCWTDDDEDGYGDPDLLLVVATCTGSKQSTNDDDCNDGDIDMHPTAPERCNGLDDDCDLAQGDLEDDDDHDQYVECTPVDWNGVPPQAGIDCDDGNPRRYPGAPEYCDGLDNDCDTLLTDEVGRASLQSGATWTDATPLLAPASVRGAFTAAAAGTLWLCNGDWHATITVPSTISQFSIQGRNGASNTVLSGALPATTTKTDRPIAHTGEGSGALTIQGLTIRDGTTAAQGGAVLFAGTPSATIQGCVIETSTALHGGGVYLTGGSLVVSNTTISANVATSDGGGLYAADGTVTLTGTDFVGNDATGNGAGLYAAAAVDTVSIQGLSDGPTSGVRPDFKQNVATGNGGGLWSSATSLDLETVHFEANEAASGGGIYLTAGTLTDSNVVSLVGNTATVSGGGLYQLAGTVNFNDLYAANNIAEGGDSAGGAALAMIDGTLDVDTCQILTNHAEGNDGGALLFDNGSSALPVASFDACTITGNTAFSEGGAFACFEDCSVTVSGASVVSGNEGVASGVMDTDGSGATFTCQNSTITGNLATGDKDTTPYLAGGVAISAAGGSVVSTNCNWGAGQSDNMVDVDFEPTARDIGGEDYGATFGAAATFECDYADCDP